MNGLFYLDAKLILSKLSGQRVKKYMNNSFFRKGVKNYRFENWNFLRAFFCPNFLRSTIRGSRVNKPSGFKTPLCSSLIWQSARDTAKRTASA